MDASEDDVSADSCKEDDLHKDDQKNVEQYEQYDKQSVPDENHDIYEDMQKSAHSSA